MFPISNATNYAIYYERNFIKCEIWNYNYGNKKNCIINKKPTSVNFDDGRIALIIANAAYESLETNKSVKINYNFN